ncbi:cytochrome P450 2J5-like protein [Anopheles sinensis]|uniref:Cytochrome P450 2J5-like protein n=1 Tax=Anopheles sinensis TaxID=74873 RepID=A0A084WEQ6_ANOSI|nr:cytochrome P450 2J5-like protein [Anopheles sinensis]
MGKPVAPKKHFHRHVVIMTVLCGFFFGHSVSGEDDEVSRVYLFLRAEQVAHFDKLNQTLLEVNSYLMRSYVAAMEAATSVHLTL